MNWSVLILFALVFSITAEGPCDIFENGNTPCVAAFSTTRALYSSYSGRLYQIQRDDTGGVLDVGVLTTGGVANSTAQDVFCKGY